MTDRGPLDFEPEPGDGEPTGEPRVERGTPASPEPARPASRPVPRPSEPSGPRPPSRPRARGMRSYGAFLMLAAAALIVVVTLNTLRSDGPGSVGVPVGKLAPVFAAPLAGGTAPPDSAVNVATKPNQGQAGKVPACSVRDPQALVSCDLTRTSPTVLAFFVTAGSRCAEELDVVERVRARTPGVAYAAVAIKGDRKKAASLAGARGWGFPVAYDYDGVLANLYGVAVCPHITYILPGGRVDGTTVGTVGEAELADRVALLERHARARGWRPPA